MLEHYVSNTACTGAQIYVCDAQKGVYFGDPPKEASSWVLECPGNPTVAEVSTYFCGQYEQFISCCHPSDVARRDAGQIWKTHWIFFRPKGLGFRPALGLELSGKWSLSSPRRRTTRWGEVNETEVWKAEKFPKLGLTGRFGEIQKFRWYLWNETVILMIYRDCSDSSLDQGC